MFPVSAPYRSSALIRERTTCSRERPRWACGARRDSPPARTRPPPLPRRLVVRDRPLGPSASAQSTQPPRNFSAQAVAPNRIGLHWRAPSPGTYTLVATKEGFESVITEGVILLVNTIVTNDVVFGSVKAIKEILNVSASGVQVNTTDASVGNAFGTKPIRQLPLNARNPAGLLSLQAGVTFLSAGRVADFAEGPESEIGGRSRAGPKSLCVFLGARSRAAIALQLSWPSLVRGMARVQTHLLTLQLGKGRIPSPPPIRTTTL